jgi:hypothetical protein
MSWWLCLQRPSSVLSQVAKIQTEILTHGPVEAAFTIYTDFPSDNEASIITLLDLDWE